MFVIVSKLSKPRPKPNRYTEHWRMEAMRAMPSQQKYQSDIPCPTHGAEPWRYLKTTNCVACALAYGAKQRAKKKAPK